MVLLRVDFGSFVAELDVTSNGLKVGLVDDGVEPPRDIDKRLAEVRVQHMRVEVQQGAGDSNVSQRDALTNQVSPGLQVCVQNAKDSLNVLLRSIITLNSTLKILYTVKPV